jgi:hypothetical protein
LLFCFLLNRFSFSVPFPFLSQDPSSEPPLFINPVPISWFLHRKLPQQIMGLIRIRQRSTHVSWYWTATVLHDASCYIKKWPSLVQIPAGVKSSVVTWMVYLWQRWP